MIFMIINVTLHKLELNLTDNDNFYFYFPMYRGLSLIIIYNWFLALNVYIWNKNYVNYKLVFKFNYHYSQLYYIIRRCSIFSLVFLSVFIFSVNKNLYENAEAEVIHY
jgi:hypothetical protein